MGHILPQIIDAVGDTPLVRLNSLTRGLDATVLVKLESMNPLGSVKDRIGAAIVTDTERDGTLEGLDLKPVGVVLDAARGVPVFLAGGVRDLKDIVALKPFTSRGLAGVVAGKALYEGTLDLAAALAAAQEGQRTPDAPPSSGGASAANRA